MTEYETRETAAPPEPDEVLRELVAEDYRDFDDNPVRLGALCADEPEWAANIITQLKAALSAQLQAKSAGTPNTDCR